MDLLQPAALEVTLARGVWVDVHATDKATDKTKQAATNVGQKIKDAGQKVKDQGK